MAIKDFWKVHRHRIIFGGVVGGASLLVLGGWVFMLVAGLNHWDKDQLQLRGTFGDSFGVITAIFSGFAFIGAAWAVILQREQLLDQRDAERKNAIDNRFFMLLGSLQTSVNATRVGDYEGRQAIRKIAEWLTKAQIGKRRNLHAVALPSEQRKVDINDWFLSFYEGEIANDGKVVHEPAGDLLGHIFRQIYHVVKFVNEAKDIDRKFFIRILRAHLSNPELVLIFYNGLSRNGVDEFFPLIEKYDLLQNISIASLPDKNDASLYKSLKAKLPASPA